MAEPVFIRDVRHLSASEIAVLVGAELPSGAAPGRLFRNVAPLETAGPDDLSYMDNPRYAAEFAASSAGLVLVSKRFAARAPADAILILTPDPQRAYAKCLAAMFPEANRPGSFFGADGVMPGAVVHPTARLEQGVVVDPGAVIGPRAEIGSGTIVAAHAVIGPDVRIGRDCSIAPHVTIQHALLGNRVILHAGVRVGQDGFGFAMGAGGHLKVPQIGRVIIQDDVEIGANSTVDRGATRDTIIGEGTKIDNLVQIGHNVVIGRHCVIVSQTGLAGSSTLEDFVVIGGQVGMAGHLTVGAGSQIAASSNIATDVPRGARWGGTPAKPMREWLREIAWVKQMSGRRGRAGHDGEEGV
jgi:UDP-3-O-[3-hydroxymyristoyl] glucosamine N-acyltransferase